MLGILGYQKRSFIKNSLYSLLNSNTKQEIKKAPEKDILNTNHQEYLEIMKDPSYGTAQHEYSTIQKIYERDKGLGVKEPMFFQSVSEEQLSLKIQILDYFSSKEVSTIADGASSVTLLNTLADPIDENKQLKDNFTFLAIDAEITNTGEDTIQYLSSYHDYVRIQILDDNGETYYSNTRNLFLTKEGDRFMERRPDNYALDNIEPGNSFIVRYVIAVPEEVFSTDLHVCALSTITSLFPVYEDEVQLRVLTDIPQK